VEQLSLLRRMLIWSGNKKREVSDLGFSPQIAAAHVWDNGDRRRGGIKTTMQWWCLLSPPIRSDLGRRLRVLGKDPARAAADVLLVISDEDGE
jgi:hypothetical protein